MPSKYTGELKNIARYNEAEHQRLNIQANDPHIYFWKPKPAVFGVLDSAVCCNWWVESVVYRDIKFRTAEHAMMWAKADLFNDQIAAAAVLETRDPWDVKAIGRQVQGFKDEVWDANSYQIVKDICYAKFTQSDRLRCWMLSQEPNAVFVEASPVDRIWGIKLDANYPYIGDMKNWRGYNLLGYALTEVMRQIRGE